MRTSFDDRAKAAAERNPADAGLSRRQLIQRGALVAGTAWAAPMLLTATPAWAGASTCGNNEHYSICPNTNGAIGKCCATGEECVLDTSTLQFTCDIPLGGDCGNAGIGNCAGGAGRCNDQHKPDSICGGAHSSCSQAGTSCYAPLVCGTDGICGGLNAACLNDSYCDPGDKNRPAGTRRLYCRNGTCQV